MSVSSLGSNRPPRSLAYGTGLQEVETQLAQDILLLFTRYHLTALQARSLLEKVRVLVEAGEMGFFNTEH